MRERGLSLLRRLPGQEIHALWAQVFGHLVERRGTGEAVEALEDAAVYQADAEGDLAELCLRQSTGDSGRPQIDVAAGVERQLTADHDIAEVQPSAGLEHAGDLAKGTVFIWRQVEHAV